MRLYVIYQKPTPNTLMGPPGQCYWIILCIDYDLGMGIWMIMGY